MVASDDHHGLGLGGGGALTTTASGRVVVERFKTFLPTWRPAGGVIRVVILKADDDS